MRLRKNLFVIFSICLVCISLTSCGRKTTNADIERYLEDVYFNNRNLILEKVIEVTEQPGELANTVIVTCTTKASNEYVEQTAKWEMLFEKFDGNMAGLEYEMHQNDYTILKAPSEEFVAGELEKNMFDWCYFQITDIKENLDEGFAECYYTFYDNYTAYYFKYSVVVEYSWLEGEMRWESGKKRKISGTEVCMKADLTGEYEYKKSDDCYERLKIEKDQDGNYILSAYEGHTGSNRTYYLKNDNGEELQFDLLSKGVLDYVAHATFEVGTPNGISEEISIEIFNDILQLNGLMTRKFPLATLECKNISEFFDPNYTVYQGQYEES